MKLNLKAFSIRRMMTTLVFIFSVVIAQFANIPFAAAATTLTWDGSAGDNKFSTAENWSGDVAPVDGDTIVFTPLAGGSDNDVVFLNNDLTNVALAGVVSTKSDSDLSKYFAINTITFAPGASITQTGSGSKLGTAIFGTSGDVGSANSSTITAQGDLSIGAGVDFYVGTANIAGNLISSGNVGIKGGSIGGNLVTKSGILTNTTVGGSITLPDSNSGLGVKGATSTIASSFTIGSTTLQNQLAFGNCATEATSGGFSGVVIVPCDTYAAATYTLTGTITLNANLIINVAQKSVVNITGTVVANGHTISIEPSSQGTLNVGQSAVTVPVTKTDLNGNNPAQNATVVNKETATLNGTRGSVYVNSGGVLKGTGTANSLNVVGTVAPGNSPGKITVLNNLSLSGTLQAELLNKDTYDQLVVGEDYSGGGNAVTLNSGATLDLVLYDGWVVKKDDAFRIIDNKSSTAVSGTFTGLAEGAQFTVDGITFSISYVGGDGNDVVVTALNTGSDPTPPDTSVAQTILRSPLAIVVLGVISAGVLAAIALRRRANQ